MVRDKNVFSLPNVTLQPGGGRGDSHMKGAGTSVISLRDVSFRFWSHLGCSEQNAIIIFSSQGLV